MVNPVSRFHKDICLTAKAMHEDAELIFSQIGLIILSIITLILLIVAILSYRKQQIALHRNLILLIGNIIFLYAFHSISIIVSQGRYQLLLYFSSDPCDFLTPMWLNILLRLPRIIYIIAFPISHLALTAERSRATFFAMSYEKEGTWYPLFCMLIVWVLSILISVSLVVVGLQDPGFWKPAVHINLTTNTNSDDFIYLHFIFLVLVVFTAVLDYVLLVLNRKNRFSIDGYSLSRTYQIKENIVVMRLIWPLDVCYAVVFVVYLASSGYLRLIQNKFSLARYTAYFDIIYMIIPMHSIVTLLLYMHFVKMCGSRPALGTIVQPPDRLRVHFQQLNAHWEVKGEK